MIYQNKLFDHQIQSASEKVAAVGLLAKFRAFAESQKKMQMAWSLVSLMVQGSILVPITFLLVYTQQGPVIIFLTISMVCFFASFVANLSDSGIRVTIISFFASIAIHVLMVLTSLFIY